MQENFFVDRNWRCSMCSAHCAELEEGINSAPPNDDLGYLWVNVWIITLARTPGSSAQIDKRWLNSLATDCSAEPGKCILVRRRGGSSKFWRCTLGRAGGQAGSGGGQSGENKFGKAEIGFFRPGPAICQLAQAASFFSTQVSSQVPRPNSQGGNGYFRVLLGTFGYFEALFGTFRYFWVLWEYWSINGYLK